MYPVAEELRTKPTRAYPSRKMLVAMLYVCTLVILVTACQPTRNQAIPRLDAQPELMNIPDKGYRLAVWLDDDRLAVTYEITSTNRRGMIVQELAVVDVATGAMQPVALTKPDECESGRLLRLDRIQANQVGLILECYSSDLRKPFQDYLIAWDAKSGEQTILHKYPPRFRAGEFAFSPDLSEMLQERNGDGLNNTLYRGNRQEELEQLFVDYYRAGAPDWSEDGSFVTFAVTPKAPEERTSLFTGLVAINNAFSQPWVIYKAKPDLSEQQVLVDSVIGLHEAKLSPDNTMLAFTATNYQREAGVFVLNLSSGEVVHVWEEQVNFGWSPDGKRLVMLLPDSQDNFDQPAILDVSELSSR